MTITIDNSIYRVEDILYFNTIYKVMGLYVIVQITRRPIDIGVY